MAKMTGLSRAQVTRLIGQYGRCGKVKVRPYRRPRFAQRYTGGDIELLARVDQAHDRLSGAATRHILNTGFMARKNMNGWPRSRWPNVCRGAKF
ncbi:MAG TPA: hypothetical protein VHA33_04325 [Candidatus Angelobacter sp.]|nr:hypothetical protein [Candidatus Angelobacter sp.]